MKEILILVDGNSLINRAYYALPPLTNAKGEFTQAVYGFTTMLIKTMQSYEPMYVAVAFDLPKPTFRHKMYDGYKATRKKMPPELASQIPLLKRQLRLMNIAVLEKEGYEADDVIGTVAKRSGVETFIITGDRDSLQLIDDKIRVVLTKRGITETVVLDEAKLKEEFSLTPRGVIDFKALAGDSSDNIPGVPGVGEKTAISLIEKYGDLDGVYSHASEISGKLGERIRANEASARMSFALATIDVNAPIEFKLDDFTYDFPFSDDVRRFFVENNFRSLTKRDDIFALDTATGDEQKERETIEIFSASELSAVLDGVKEVAFHLGDDVHFSFDGEREYVAKVHRTLIDEGMTLVEVIGTFKPVLESSSVKKFVYDGKKLKRTLASFGVALTAYDDVRLRQFLADMRVKSDSCESFAELNGYGAEVACALKGKNSELKKEIADKGMTKLYEDIELPLEEVLYDMEERGVQIDTDVLDSLGKKYSTEAMAEEQAIYALAGRTFNINSPKQLAEVLFDELKIPYPGRTKKRSTSAEVLSQIVDKHEIVPRVLRYRFLAKLNSTYIEGIRKLLDGNGVVHTEYKQMLTTTGRLSSVEPNLQNIPVRDEEGKALRGLFVARKGYTLVSADYSQIELRLLAHFSGDEIMLKLYRDGEDIHSRTAAEVFGVPLSEVTESMRRKAKTVNFGIVYGMSDYGLSESLGCPVWEARRYMEKYFERFKSIAPYFADIVARAKETGYTTTLMGRVRYIPELGASNYMTRQFGERAAMNMPLQGSAADIIKMAMVAVHRRLKGTDSALILQIHDELIIEAREEEAERVRDILVEEMENAVKLRVPLVADWAIGKSWIDC